MSGSANSLTATPTVQATPTGQSVVTPSGQPSNPNIMNMSAQGMTGAMYGTGQAMGYTPQSLANVDYSKYQNPYTQQVIDAQAQDVLRNAQLGLNTLSGQAQRAGAFGGSRHGVAMGEIGRGVAETLGQQSAALRQQGFQQAQQTAQQDIANQLSGAEFRLGAANQLGNLSNLGFGMGNTITDRLAQQGQQQQALQQQLIDIAQQRYGQYTGMPAQTLGYVPAALGQAPVPQTTQQNTQRGLFDYLTLAAMTKMGMGV